MKPSEMVTFLAAMFQAKLPTLIEGPPGVGKSDIVEQAAKLAGAHLIKSHPAVSDPTDVKGLPWVAADHDTARFLPFGDLAAAMAATELTVWDLEDLGQATGAMQAGYMQLILAREVNGHKLPEHVVFVASTNRRTDRAGVSGILEPVKSRFAAIVQLQPSLDDWCSWAFDHSMPPELIAFIRFRPDLLCKFEPTADMTNSPVPRTWANAGRLLGLGLPRAIQHEAIVGAVGEGAAVEFGAFLRLFRELPSIDAILVDPDSVALPREPATRYAVVTALALRADASNFDKVGRYAERLTEEGAGEFAVLLVRDATRKDPDIMQTQAFVRLASGDLGQLISGGAR